MKRAIERHECGKARVIPIVLRPAFWQRTAFATLKSLPSNDKPVGSWQDQQFVYQEVAEGILRAAAEAELRSHPQGKASSEGDIVALEQKTLQRLYDQGRRSDTSERGEKNAPHCTDASTNAGVPKRAPGANT
jgi:hypothetical protein